MPACLALLPGMSSFPWLLGELGRVMGQASVLRNLGYGSGICCKEFGQSGSSIMSGCVDGRTSALLRSSQPQWPLLFSKEKQFFFTCLNQPSGLSDGHLGGRAGEALSPHVRSLLSPFSLKAIAVLKFFFFYSCSLPQVIRFGTMKLAAGHHWSYYMYMSVYLVTSDIADHTTWACTV